MKVSPGQDSSHLFNFSRSIINWDNPGKSIGAFIGFLLGVYFFEPWMITLGLVIPFLKNIIVSPYPQFRTLEIYL